MTGIIGFGKRTLLYGAGQGINRLLSVITLPIFTAILSPHEFGIIAMLVVISLIARPIFELGLSVSTGTVYFAYEKQADRNAVIGTAFLLISLSSVIFLVISALAAPGLGPLVLHETDSGFLLLVWTIAIALQMVIQPLLLWIQFQDRAGAYVLITVGASIVGVLAAIGFVVGLKRGVLGWVEGQIVHGIVSLFIVGWIFRGDLPRGFRVQIAKRLLRLSSVFVPGFAFLYLIQYGGHSLLRFMDGLEVLGIYNIGYSIGMGMALAVGGFIAAWQPFFQSYLLRQDLAKEVFRRIALLYAVGFGFVLFLFFLLARPAVYILTTAEFYDAWKVIGLVAVAQFLLGAWSLLLPGVYFARQLYFVPMVQATAAVIAVLTSAALIPILGIEGAALGTVLGALALAGSQYMVNVVRGFDVCNYDWHRLGLVGATTLTAIILQINIDRLAGPHGVMVLGAMLLILYGVIVWFVLPIAERKNIMYLLSQNWMALTKS